MAKKTKKDGNRYVQMEVPASEAFRMMFDRHVRKEKEMEARSKLKHAPLSTFERDLLFGSIRYYCNRASICALTFPQKLVDEWWFRISDTDKEIICRDLKDELDRIKRFSNGERTCFDGMCNDVERDIWQKFMAVLDKDSYRECVYTDGSHKTVFPFNGRYYEIWFFLAGMDSAVGVPMEEFEERDGLLYYIGEK